MPFVKMQNWAWSKIGVALALMCCMSLLLAGAVKAAEGDAPPQQEEPKSIQVMPGDGMNLEIVDQISANYVVVGVNSPVHNWFAGTFTNLPTDEEVTIGLSLEGMDTTGNKADVSKWRGLRPVMTYADPMRYETYEWFTKNEQGRWVSGDPLKHGEAKYAGNGNVPDQIVMPKEIASAFLSIDGKYWSAWREVDNVEAMPGLNIFRIHMQCSLPTITVCMRIPFTYTYLQQFIERLKAAQLPGIFVDEIGVTPDKQKLQIIRVDDLNGIAKTEDRKTIVYMAREHATEHASSWSLFGALLSILADEQYAKRRTDNTTVIFIPIFDPAGSSKSQFDRLTDRFRRPNDRDTPPEIFDYARYFTDYISSGRTVDVIITLHNVEATECPNIYSPFIDENATEQTIDYNRNLFSRVQEQGYLVGLPDQPWGRGLATFRLYGWCALHFGSLDLAFEINDRFPNKRLNQSELQRIGEILAEYTSEWCAGPNGMKWHASANEIVSARNSKRALYFQQAGYKSKKRSNYDMITLGY